MCGLTGFLGVAPGTTVADAEALLESMASALTHRGPDGSGVFFGVDHPIGLAHRRLAILDLSPAGHQPMSSRDGRFVIAFNGEVYNHTALRTSLEARQGPVPWRGHSDTETLLEAISVWGLEETLRQTIGMFALALWDKRERTLTLARDRFGEKPLYYGWFGTGANSSFVFGSELKALRRHPGFKPKISRGALSLLMRHNYIPAPHSIYDGICKLSPGCVLRVSLENREPMISRYWSFVETARSGIADPFGGSETEAVDELEKLLTDSVRQQMIADVPLGAFLSGGIDSSTIVALMQKQSPRPVKTFTIGFSEGGYNEAEHAKAVAAHLGTDHTELYVTPAQARNVIPRLPAIFCEPFSDSSQIPTFLVADLAKRSVTVSLSGDAGDELFTGYNRYTVTDALWKRLNRIPAPMRAALRGMISLAPLPLLDAVGRPIQALLPPSLRQNNLADKLRKGHALLAAQDIDALYRRLVSHWEPAEVVVDAAEPATNLTGLMPDLADFDPIQRMMALDSITYLPDDILVKVDRTAMAVSLETRVPFLDHRVAQLAWRLPQSMKLRGGVGKWILRQVLYRHVPQPLIDRPKMGFAVPIDSWLRGPLRGWAEHLLDRHRMEADGFFHAGTVHQRWQEHVGGRQNWHYWLWDILMFQAWLDESRGRQA